MCAQYAIRHNIRNHNTFKSDVVIKKIAGLIDKKHKVNLSKPDKVIHVEIFQVRRVVDCIQARHLAATYEAYSSFRGYFAAHLDC